MISSKKEKASFFKQTTPENIAQAVDRFKQDSFLACLMFTVRYYRKIISSETLLRGLPLKENTLDVSLFKRAAQRAGLYTHLLERSLDDIENVVLPAVLLMKKGDAALLLEKGVSNNKPYYKVYLPASGAVQKIFSIEKLKQQYSGQIILMKYVQKDPSTFRRMSNKMHWFWGSLRQFKTLYVQVVLASVMINLLALASPLFVMNVYDRVVPNNAFETLWVLSIGVFFAFLFDLLLKILRAYFVDVAGRGADVLMASTVFQHILNARLGQVKATSGAFANQVRDYETVREFLTSATLVTCVDLPFVFLFVLIIASIAGPVAWIPLAAIPLVLFLSFSLQKPLEKLMTEIAERKDHKHSHLIETLMHIEMIKALGAQGRMQHKWEEAVGLSAHLNLRARFLTSLALNGAGFIQQMTVIFMVITGVYFISLGELTVGALVAATILSGRTMAPLSQAAALYSRFYQTKTAWAGLNQVMHMDVENPEGKDFVYLPKVAGDYEFDSVSFQYPESVVASLKNITLKISEGEKVAIIGRAGSGKSTLLRLLLGLYTPEKGLLTLGGVDLRQQDSSTYRRYISYVPQNTALFKGTLRENIMVAEPNATLESVRHVLKISGVDLFVKRHPLGLEMPIFEGGINLSGGQRQTVILARALLRHSQIWLMDEPTSHLDANTEAEVLASIRSELQNKTLVLVTHKMNLLELVDRVIVMEEGRIIADGAKDKILKQLNANNYS